MYRYMDAACHNQARFFHRVVKALDANLAAPSSDLPQLIAQTECGSREI